jgi:nucleoside phosphorylase
MIGISFALPTESSGVLRQLKSKQVSNASNVPVFHGELGGVKVAIFHTGVGRTHAQRNVQAALGAIQPRLLISSGFAGSLTGRLGVGDLLVAQNFSDWKLATGLLEAKPPSALHPGVLFTSSRVVESAAEREQIAQQQRADAIDMETEVIATACAVKRIPMIALRVISDSPSAPFPAPAEILFDMASQRTNYAKLIGHIMAHPSAIGRLLDFAKQIARARTSLTTALIDIVPRL